AHSGRVRLHHANPALDVPRRHARTGRNPRRAAVRAGHIRIATVIDIEQGALRPFKHEPAPRANRLVEPAGRVANEWPKALGVAQVLFGDRIRVERLEIGQHGRKEPVLVLDDPSQVLAELGRVGKISYADPMYAADLVAITRSNPAPGGAEVVGRG